MLDRWSRFAPLTGLVFGALIVVVVVTSGSSPNSKASGAKVIHYYSTHRNNARVTDILLAFAAVFFLLFAGTLRARLRRVDAAEALSALCLAAGVLLCVGLASSAAIDYSLADVPGRLSPSAAQALSVLDNNLFVLPLIGAGTFGVVAGLAVLRAGTLPGWLGWTAVVIGVATFTPVSWIGLLAMVIWTIVVSVLLLVRDAAPAPMTATGAAAPTPI